MKFADIVPAAESGLRLRAQFEDVQLPQLVGQSLSRPRNIAVGFSLHVGLVFGGVLVKVVNHLLAGPVFVVDSGIEHQANGAQQFVRETTEVRIGVLIQADLFAGPSEYSAQPSAYAS